MISRARSSTGIPIQIRAATNPGGIGHPWVFKRFEPWLNRKHALYTPGGKKRWVLYTDDGEHYVTRGTPKALSRVFIPATLSDNPALAINDPTYVDRLAGLDPVTRAQLRDGDWLAAASKGEYFKRGWFKMWHARPADDYVLARVRAWDFAATEEKRNSKGKKNDPDWTVGVRMSRLLSGLFVVENVVRLRGTPGEVDATVKSTARLDGPRVKVRLPQDPGSAGKVVAHQQVTNLAGYDATFERMTGDKISRAGPYSAQVQAGNVVLIEDDWTDKYLRELEAFPEGSHDDQVDASSDAFNSLCPEAYDLRKLVMSR